MSRYNTVRIKKTAMILSAMLLMLLLCGCRTRVTNNTEVTNVLEGSGMEETYQIRRDELGIPVAETPLFTGWESDEEYDEEDYYEDYEDLDYEDDEYYDDEEDDEISNDVTDPVRNNTNNSTNTNTRTGGQQLRPGSNTTGTTTEPVRITLDVNAKDAEISQAYVVVRKGGTYGTLPEPTRSGYDFKGWYTEKEKGSKVTSDTKLKSDKAHTLYAHWKKTEKKTYTLIFDGNGGDDEVTLSSTEKTVKEDGKYGELPSAKRKKYSFTGWFTEAEEGSQVTSSTKFTANADQTLYAHWEYDPYTWWDNEFKTASNEIEEDIKAGCVIDGGDDTEEDFVKACKGDLKGGDTSPAFIIKFIKNYDDETAAKEAEELYRKYSETAPGAKVIIISDKAIKGSKEQQLLYKMMLFDAIYGSGGSTDDTTDTADKDALDRINEAYADLLDEDSAAFYPYVYPGADYVQPVDEQPAEPVNDQPVEVVDDQSSEAGDQSSETGGQSEVPAGDQSDAAGGQSGQTDDGQTAATGDSQPAGE